MDKILRKKSTILSFLIPALVVYTLVVFVPIVWSFVVSFTNWDGFTGMTFAGIQNYVRMLAKDKYFWPVVRQTLVYVALQIVFQVGGGLLLALLLAALNRGRAVLQTAYFIPVIISSVAICQIFSKLLSVTPEGFINHLLSLVGVQKPIEWLTTPGLSLVTAAFVEGFKTQGTYMVVFLAALLTIPGDIVEAGRIDGANSWQILMRIKLPYISHIILANSVLVLNNSLRSFDIPYLLTAGGPGTTSELLASYMYKQAFSSMKYGYGSAISVFIVALAIVLASLFMRQFDTPEEN